MDKDIASSVECDKPKNAITDLCETAIEWVPPHALGSMSLDAEWPACNGFARMGAHGRAARGRSSGRWHSRACGRVTRRTPRSGACRRSASSHTGPSDHQWPSSSVSTAKVCLLAAATGATGAASAELVVAGAVALESPGKEPGAVFGAGTVCSELAGGELTPARIAERSQTVAPAAPGILR